MVTPFIAVWLSLTKLGSFTGFMKTVFLSLLHSGVAGKEACGLECGTVSSVGLAERSGNAVSDGAGLAGYAAAQYVDGYIELIAGSGKHEGLGYDILHRFEGEVFIQPSLVDDDGSFAGNEADARDSGLTAACSPVLNLLFDGFLHC